MAVQPIPCHWGIVTCSCWAEPNGLAEALTRHRGETPTLLQHQEQGYTFMAKVAIPNFRSRVAPVFDYCVRVSVFEIGDDRQIERSELYLGTLSPIERVRALIKEGVTTLVCGAMSDALDKLFQTSGISVIGSVGGPVEEVLEALMSDRLDEPQYRSPGMEGEKHAPPHKRREATPYASSVEGTMGSSYGQALTRADTTFEAKPKVRILLVEKDIASQQSALGIFQKSGCEVDAVSNGREAIKALELTCYDLVFMDVQVLEMDAYEATKAIRDPQSTVRCHHVPVIAMTRYSEEEDQKRYIESGMNDCICKPIEPKRLRQIINTLTPPAHADSSSD
jgi:CheY-like chemotaxis protein/predicted Fe-Mo cluster-binding NifX family protein